MSETNASANIAYPFAFRTHGFGQKRLLLLGKHGLEASSSI